MLLPEWFGQLMAAVAGTLAGVYGIWRTRPAPPAPRSPLTEQLTKRDTDAYIDRLERECKIGPYSDPNDNGQTPARPHGYFIYPEAAPGQADGSSAR